MLFCFLYAAVDLIFYWFEIREIVELFMPLFSSFYGCFLANLATSSKQKDHKHEKPMFLKDYQRKIVLEKDG